MGVRSAVAGAFGRSFAGTCRKLARASGAMVPAPTVPDKVSNIEQTDFLTAFKHVGEPNLNMGVLCRTETASTTVQFARGSGTR